MLITWDNGSTIRAAALQSTRLLFGKGVLVRHALLALWMDPSVGNSLQYRDAVGSLIAFHRHPPRLDCAFLRSTPGLYTCAISVCVKCTQPGHWCPGWALYKSFVPNVTSPFITPSLRPLFEAVFWWKKNKDKPKARCAATVFRFVLIITYGHTAATMLANAGVPPKQLQAFLGHDDIEMTLGVYVHTSGNAAAETSNRMDETMRAIRFGEKCSDFCSELSKAVKLG